MIGCSSAVLPFNSCSVLVATTSPSVDCVVPGRFHLRRSIPPPQKKVSALWERVSSGSDRVRFIFAPCDGPSCNVSPFSCALLGFHDNSGERDFALMALVGFSGFYLVLLGFTES